MQCGLAGVSLKGIEEGGDMRPSRRKPAVGKMVHFVEWDEREERRLCRAAFITQVGEEYDETLERDVPAEWCCLAVLGPGVLWFVDLAEHEECKTALTGPGSPGTWHWPEPE